MVVGAIAAGLGLGILGRGGAASLAGKVMRSGYRAGSTAYASSAKAFPRAVPMARRAAIGGGMIAASVGALNAVAPMMDERFLSKHGDTEENRQYLADRSGVRKAAFFGAPLAAAGGALGAAGLMKLGGRAAGAIGMRAAKAIPIQVAGVAGTEAALKFGGGVNPFAGAPAAVKRGLMVGANAFNPTKAGGAFIYGGAAGVAVGIGGAAATSTSSYGREGQITGISSSRGGGISPELQFSTQGLTLGLHSTRKRRVV